MLSNDDFLNSQTSENVYAPPRPAFTSENVEASVPSTSKFNFKNHLSALTDSEFETAMSKSTPGLLPR